MLSNLFIVFIDFDKGIKNKQLLLSSLECFTYIGGGMLYFISAIREKTEEIKEKAKIKDKESNKKFKLIYNNRLKSKQNYFKIYSILFIMSLSISIFDICEVYSFDENIFEERLYIIFFISLFSRIILKVKIYNHQILALFITFIGMILLFFPKIFIMTNNDIYINIYLFFASIPFALFLVLIKYVTYNYYISPYLCLLFVGSISTTITLIYFIVYSLAVYKDLSFIINGFDFSGLKLGKWIYIYILLIFIFGSLLQTCSFLVIYYFSPTLLMVTDGISPFLLWILKIIFYGEEERNIIFYCSGYFTVFIGSLIFNEIIICNFCNLNKYTKKVLAKREKEELLLLNQTQSSDFNDNYNENDNDTSYSEDN